MYRAATLAMVLALSCAGADKGPPSGSHANEELSIEAQLHADRESVKRLLGSDFDGFIVVVQVNATPKGGKPLAISRDDFWLRSDKDGQRSQPFAPSQIAGRAAITVTTRGRGGMVSGNENGPIWGGAPGSGDRPRRLGGDGGVVGNGGEGTTEARVTDGAKQKEDPALAALTAKQLPDKTTSEPVNGLLYFPLEGKHKAKDLELVYRGPAGKLAVRFK